jgi:hypothetical protein
MTRRKSAAVSKASGGTSNGGALVSSGGLTRLRNQGGLRIGGGPAGALGELGGSGLKVSAGRPDEEWNPKIRGRRWTLACREMLDQDATIGTGFTLIELVAHRVAWRLDIPKEAEGAQAARDAQQFVDECLNDMEHSLPDAITEAISGKLGFGFHVDEVVWKVRGGATDDETRRSKFNDGRLGIRKFASRAQESLDHWQFDEANTPTAFVQKDPVTGLLTEIPLSRCLLFRHRPRKNNPEGRSILRHSWLPYFYAKRIREGEAVGIERDFTGMPMFFVPPELLADTTTPQASSLISYLSTLMQQITTGERNGALLPSEVDENGKPTGWSFKLMASPGQKSIDPDKVIRRYEASIAMCLMVEFILLGTGNTGSWALDDGKQTRFGLFIEGILAEVQGVLQRLIDKLCALNGIAPEFVPQLAFGDVRAPDLQQIAQLLLAAHQVDALDVDDGLRDWIRQVGNFPERAVDAPGDAAQQRLEQALERAQKRGDTAMVEAIRQKMHATLGMEGDTGPLDTGPVPVRDTALQGPQAAALLQIVQAVGQGTVPAASAKAMIAAAFPGMNGDQIAAMVDPIQEGSTPKPVPVPFGGAQPPSGNAPPVPPKDGAPPKDNAKDKPPEGEPKPAPPKE